jgi:hypothetical protein
MRIAVVRWLLGNGFGSGWVVPATPELRVPCASTFCDACDEEFNAKTVSLAVRKTV